MKNGGYFLKQFFFYYFLLVILQLQATKITVIGAGYVGLVTSAILADLGHTVLCADIDKSKIEQLNNNIIPIFEPGLQDLIKDVSFSVKATIQRNIAGKRLSFSHQVGLAVQEADIIFLSVGTPTDENGQANLNALKAATLTIAKNLNTYKIICIKSTVPIGTYKVVKEIIEKNSPKQVPFDIVSNPEFLREGSALQDFLTRNPIVIGASSEYAQQTIKNLYKPLIDGRHLELILTDNITAETIKYSWNAFSAIKISYVNEIAELCQKTGADIFTVIKGMSSSDKLLPLKAIVPGPGFGGSCLPKDTKAFVNIADSLGLNLYLVKAAIDSNTHRKQEVAEKILSLLESPIQDKTVTLLGLSFKANTDDIRYSPALEIIPALLAHGVHVQAYDPAAMKNMEKLYPQVTYCSSSMEAVNQTNLIVILTEWQEFKHLDFKQIAQLVRNKVILDSRYLLTQSELIPSDYVYIN